jgi:hypothetical protein
LLRCRPDSSSPRRKHDIASLQRSLNNPSSRRRMSALASALQHDASVARGLDSVGRSSSVPRASPGQRDTSKGKSAVYSRELLNARGQQAAGLSPADAAAALHIDSKPAVQPLFLDTSKRKSKGSTPTQSTPDPGLAAAKHEPKPAMRPNKSAMRHGHGEPSDTGHALAEADSPIGPSRSSGGDGVVVVKPRSCCVVM